MPGERRLLSFATDITPAGRADFVSFLDGDGQEGLLIRRLEGLDEESRAALEEELRRIYFMLEITRIYTIEDAHGAARWEVETDGGYRVFDVRDREEVRVVESTRVLLQEAHGNRFEAAADPAQSGGVRPGWPL